MTTLQPKCQAALLAAYRARNHALRRIRGGYTAPGEAVYTTRVINWLDRAYLVTFDPPDFPRTVTLNARGSAHAELLLSRAAGMEKAS